MKTSVGSAVVEVVPTGPWMDFLYGYGITPRPCTSRPSMLSCGSASAALPRAPCAHSATRRSAARRAPCRLAAATSAPPSASRTGATHSLTKERLEVVRDLHGWAGGELLTLLKPVDKCWQPADWLPASESPGFIEQVQDLRARAKGLPDSLLVVLVGDMITEEALPTYMSQINRLDGVSDETGSDDTPWATWTRAWVAEEKRHGEALGRYLYLTGRVNSLAIDRTIQRLISSGQDPQTEENPYLGFVYTSFQERATKVCHGNTARMAKQTGDEVLAKLTGLIAADEGRHEVAYQKIVEQLAQRDPKGVMLAFEKMMRKTIQMPAHLIDDGEYLARTGKTLFSGYAAVAESLGVYDAHDYADIQEHLLQRWGIGGLKVGETGPAAEAQHWLMAQPARMRRLAEMAASRRAKKAPAMEQFSWVFDRPVAV